MTPVQTLGFVLGASFAAGLNVYATIATLGLLQRLEVIRLPESLQMLANPVVLGVAATLYVIEFIADKVPYVDSVWDVVHTFIRPPAAGLLAYSALGGVPEEWRFAAALLAGSVALGSHATKAGTRAAANTSPEPFSNWILSLGEDALAVFLTWMAVTHPVWTAVIVALLLALCGFVLWKVSKFLVRLFRRVFRRTSPQASESV